MPTPVIVPASRLLRAFSVFSNSACMSRDLYPVNTYGIVSKFQSQYSPVLPSKNRRLCLFSSFHSDSSKLPVPIYRTRFNHRPTAHQFQKLGVTFYIKKRPREDRSNSCPISYVTLCITSSECALEREKRYNYLSLRNNKISNA